MICFKCWDQAYVRSLYNQSKTQREHYLILLIENKNNTEHIKWEK